MTRLLRLSAALMCLAIGWCAYRASLAADAVRVAAVDTAKAVSNEARTARWAIERVEVLLLGWPEGVSPYPDGVRGIIPDLVSRTDLRVGDTLARADKALATLKQLESDANRQTSDALAIVKDAAALTITEVQGLRTDLKPTLDNAAATVKQAGDLVAQGNQLVGDNYFDIQAGIQSSTVTITSLGRMGDEMARAAPKLTESAVGIGKSADGIAADVHTATSDFTRPRTKWEKFKSAVFDVGKIAARLL